MQTSLYILVNRAKTLQFKIDAFKFLCWGICCESSYRFRKFESVNLYLEKFKRIFCYCGGKKQKPSGLVLIRTSSFPVILFSHCCLTWCVKLILKIRLRLPALKNSWSCVFRIFKFCSTYALKCPHWPMYFMPQRNQLSTSTHSWNAIIDSKVRAYKKLFLRKTRRRSRALTLDVIRKP